MAEEPPRHDYSGAAGYVSAVFAYVDRPWKVAALIAMFVVGLGGWLVYEKRDELLEAWLTPDMPELITSEVPAALATLTADTNADIVQIWSVDFSANSQTFLGARRHDGERPIIPSPRRLPIIDRTSDVRRLVDVLDGRPVCADFDHVGTPVVRRLAQRGMKRGCGIPIPPGGDAFLGIIYLSWAEPTDEHDENVAVGVAKEVAKRLATH